MNSLLSHKEKIIQHSTRQVHFTFRHRYVSLSATGCSSATGVSINWGMDGTTADQPPVKHPPTHHHYSLLLAFPTLLITAHRTTSTKPTSDRIHSPLLAARS